MTGKRRYGREDIRRAYEQVGVSKGMTVLVHSDLGRLFAFEEPGREAVLAAHYDILRTLVGDEGTIVVHAGNVKLCNTDTVFDPETTPSALMGVFSEYVRQLPGAQRRFHPFISYAAVGPRAREIVETPSRQAWGPGTPKDRLIEMDALCLSVGVPPNLSCSTVHHTEQVMGVPYRYTKEFVQPVRRGDEVVEEPFYMFVTYMNCDIERDLNKKIFADFEHDYALAQAPLGLGAVWSYSLADFYASTVKSFTKDIYVWLSRPPEDRPFRK